jgi:Prokaryotic N-terminal methylation motif
MINKNLLKRRPFTLIEVVIAMALIAVILTQGFVLITRQIQNQAELKKLLDNHYGKKQVLQDLSGYFFHLIASDPKCLEARDNKINIFFDAGTVLDPELSGPRKGLLFLRNKTLICQILLDAGRIHETIISNGVEEFSLKFYSSKSSWQTMWESQSMGLPESVSIVLRTDKFRAKQKFLLPFNLAPLQVSCKSSPSSYL